MKTRAFCRKTGLCRPEVRTKCPSSIAPHWRNTSSTCCVSIRQSPLSPVQPMTRSALPTIGLDGELADDPRQMADVPDLEIEDHLHEVGRGAMQGQIGDVGVVRGDDLGDLRQRSRLVDGGNAHARGEALAIALLDVPAHVEPALRLVVELRQFGRLDRIDRDALARRDDADDAVAGHGAAAGREAHRQVAARAADGDGLSALVPALVRIAAAPGIWNSMPVPALQAEPAVFLGRLRDVVDALVLVVGIDGAQHVDGGNLAAARHRPARPRRFRGQGAAAPIAGCRA